MTHDRHRHHNVHERTRRNRRKGFVTSLAAAGFVTGGSLAQADTFTTLTGLSDTNMDVPVNHGSNAEATLAWATEWDQYANWDGRGDVYQVDQRTANIVFTPANAGVKITINSFELDEYAGGGDTSLVWSVTGSTSGLISSGLWDNFNAANDPTDAGGRSLEIATAVGLPGETLTVLFDHSNSQGAISYLAMDNLTFSTMIIPEPATAVMTWLGVGGLGAMAMRRKRK
jgi:hypothetical protein